MAVKMVQPTGEY